MKEVLAIAAGVLALAGNIPYLRDILKGHTQPHPYTWLVSSIVSGTILFGMLAKGAGIGALPVAVSEAFTIIIFFFSLKYGFRGITGTDQVFLAIAIAGLIPWAFTSDPTLSIIIAVGIDLAALVPTFRKTWTHPFTETPVLYSSNVLRHILVISSLQTYNIATLLHSLAMIGTNTAMSVLLLMRRRKTIQ